MILAVEGQAVRQPELAGLGAFAADAFKVFAFRGELLHVVVS